MTKLLVGLHNRCFNSSASGVPGWTGFHHPKNTLKFLGIPYWDLQASLWCSIAQVVSRVGLFRRINDAVSYR